MNLLTLIRIEWLKLVRYKAFWTIFGIFTVIFYLGCQIAAQLTSSMNINGSPMDFTHMMKYPAIWKGFSWYASFFFYLFTFLIALIISNEFECRTVRQHVIDGLSRVEIVIGKFLVVLFFAAFVCALVAFFAGIFGSGTVTKSYFDGIERLGPLFLQGVGHLSFVVLVTLFVRRAALAIITATLYPIIIEPIIGYFLNQQSNDILGKYLPFEVFSELSPLPVSTDAIGLKTEVLAHAPIIASIYIGLFLFAAICRLKTMDL